MHDATIVFHPPQITFLCMMPHSPVVTCNPPSKIEKVNMSVHRGLKTSGGIAFFAYYGTERSDVPHYRALDILLNGGKMTALIDKVIYTAIYACISLRIFVS